MSTDDWKEGSRRSMDWELNKPLGPIVISILAMVVWLVFILLYALYWSSGFSLFQNVIVTIVSLIITGLLIGLAWVVWGMKHASKLTRSWHRESPNDGSASASG
jgi:hypothetical protein